MIGMVSVIGNSTFFIFNPSSSVQLIFTVHRRETGAWPTSRALSTFAAFLMECKWQSRRGPRFTGCFLSWQCVRAHGEGCRAYSSNTRSPARVSVKLERMLHASHDRRRSVRAPLAVGTAAIHAAIVSELE